MPRLDPDTKLMIEAEPDGRFTFRVKFRGAVGPKSRPMDKREDVELLGATLLRKLEHDFRQVVPLDSSAAAWLRPSAESSLLEQEA
jgi:hypothetical protein